MERLLEMLFSGHLPLPFLNPDLLALDRELSKTELLALMILDRRGEATMSELAADLGVPLSTATGIGVRLARRGLIVRERSPQDRRAILNRLTGKGRELAERARGHIDGLLKQVAAALTPDEMVTLVALVEKVLRHLGAAPRAGGGRSPRRDGPQRIPLD